MLLYRMYPSLNAVQTQELSLAQLSDLLLPQTKRALFLVFQAFIDESFDMHEEGACVLAGCISTAEQWSEFSKEWKSLLPIYGKKDKNGVLCFKTKLIDKLPDADERMEAFYRCIENHVHGFISCKFDGAELKRAKSRVQIEGVEIEWHKFHTYMVCYRYLMDKFHIERPKMADAIPMTEKVDFYFDEKIDKKAILGAWEEYIQGRPEETRSFYGAAPRFENDNEFLPLQAADFWAGWVRKFYDRGTPENLRQRDFGAFKKNASSKKYLTAEILINEDDMVENFIRIAKNQTNKPIIDVINSTMNKVII